MNPEIPLESDVRTIGRYAVGRCLGAGTFGVVYEARDESRGTRVALKKLSEVDAAAIFAFKQEFRALADVVHPNLVALHELFSAGDQLFLAMELVEGETFLEYVRETKLRAFEMANQATIEVTGASLDTVVESLPDAIATISVDTAFADTLSDPLIAARKNAVPSSRRVRPLVNFERLRGALLQLASGVQAIHAAGKLHRDLKPSNVMVTEGGRVVILDFGLVASVSARGVRETIDPRVVGTPAYMSPEQAVGAALGPSSDWYAFGVMLYEALTGQLPITGTVAELLTKKYHLDPPDPRVLAPGAPDDLTELCVALLRRAPHERPLGSSVLRALGAEAPEAIPESTPWSGEVLPFVGREHHLSMLEEAFAAARHGRAVTVHVHGTSGMGKSALLHRFLDGLADRDGAVVLEGRCYERESVPYKAVDSLIDALTQHLRGLPAEAIDPLVPRDVQLLARLFPVLRRVDAIAHAPKRAEAPDPQELRRRAFAALREILARMAARRPLVICIDDLQWGDADSAALLIDLLEPPDPPGLLLIASYRSEDVATIDLVRVVRERLARGELESDVRELVVGPLAHREARALARVLLAGEPIDTRGDAEQIATESAGSPFFVHELARHVRSAGPAPGRRAISLDEALAGRLARLPAEARRVLEAIAVAGHPLPCDAVCRAAGVPVDAPALAVLRAEHLVRGRGSRDRAEIETFHDRIRETAVARLSPTAIIEHHRRLAEALEAEGDVDPETLFIHFAGAGDLPRALTYVEKAAERAEIALAFDRAAALWRRAIELRGGVAPQPLRARLAHALANAGRGTEAAHAYVDATVGADAAEALDLRRRAAEQFLRTGHIDEGLAAIREVLAYVDLELPRSPARALASIVLRRGQISLRGLSFTERAPAEVRPDDLTRIDVCWAVGNGLGGVDAVRAADFQARHLLYALSAGEPYRIARALAWEAIFAGMEGGRRGRARAASLADRASSLAQRIQHPHAIAWAAGAKAGTAHYDHRFRDAVTLGDQATTLFRERCRDITWEVASIQSWWVLPALFLLGEIRELARRAPLCLREAQELGALYYETSLRTYAVARLLLAMDRPIEMRRECTDAIKRWSNDGWHTQHYCDWQARVFSYLYEGSGAAALACLDESWPSLDRSLLLRIEIVRFEALHMRGAARIAAALEPGANRSSLLSAAERDARELEGLDVTIARGMASALRGSVARARGRPDRAVEAYAQATTRFDALGMGLHAAAMRRRQGELTGGDEGRALVRTADAWMQGQQIRNPERMAAIIAPV